MAKKKRPRPIRRKKDNLATALEHAVESGHYMVAVFTLNGDRVQLYRKTEEFPREDFDTAIDLLERDLRKERGETED